MYRITRVSTTPAAPIRIWVDGPTSDPDGQFARGGRFEFYPAGSDKGPDSYQVSDHVAKAIMDDPGIAANFQSDPPWEPQAAAQAIDGGQEGQTRRGRKKPPAQGEATPTVAE